MNPTNVPERQGGFCRVVRQFLADESGQDIIEYGLLGALIGIAAVVIWQQLATTVGVVYGDAVAMPAGGNVQGLSACTPNPDGTGC